MKGGLGRYRGRLISTGGTHVHGGSEAREKKERGIILRNIYPLSLFAKSSLPLERERETERASSLSRTYFYTNILSLCVFPVPCRRRRRRRRRSVPTVLRPRIGISNNSLARPFVYSTITIIDRYRVDNTRGYNNRFVEIPKEIPP